MILEPIWLVLTAAVALLAATLVWAVRHWLARSRAGRAGIVVRVLLALVAVAIGLHPVGAARVSVPRETTADLVLLVDRTTSMGAQDHAGGKPRMQGVAADLSQLVQDLSGAQVAVVVFDDDARLAVPFTTDVTTVSGFLRTVGWRPSTKASGSDISVGVEVAEQLLRKAAAVRPDHDRYLVYVGDGEQTADKAPASFAPLKDLVTGALVLGYGTTTGGQMATRAGSDELVRVDGAVQRSRIDQAALTAIAEQLGADYHHRTGAGALPELVPPGSATSVSRLVPGKEFYWILALVGALGLLQLLWSSVSAMRAAREEVTDAPGGPIGG